MYSRRQIFAGAVALSGSALFPSLSAGAPSPGSYSGDPIVRLLENGRDFELLQDFSFTDNSGVEWLSPKGIVVNGASIPRLFWSYIGGPLTGKFRNASIIHDHHCVIRASSHEIVHAVFYEGMIASGVRQSKAWVMYKAVETFGPKWTRSIPRGCLKEGALNLEDCVQNSVKPPKLLPQTQITQDDLDKYFAELRLDGFGDEVAVIQGLLQ